MTAQNVTLPVGGPAGSTSPVVEGMPGVGGATRQVVSAADYPVIPIALANNAVATGGAAVVVATGPINGGYIANPLSPYAQNLSPSAPENLYLDMVATPGATDALAFGTTILLVPGQDFMLPALAAGVVVRVNAATSGHRFAGALW